LSRAKAVVFCEPPVPVGFDELRSLGNEILAACAPRPNSVLVTVVEEIVDTVLGLADIGREVKLVSRQLRFGASGARVSDLIRSANQLDKLTAESNEGLRFLLLLLSDLVEQDS
jgi:hypothetical protein